jgi:hypothetical protein
MSALSGQTIATSCIAITAGCVPPDPTTVSGTATPSGP